ncbi:DUF454 family protein [Phenylobacterium sp.]|uniref:DUF454 family protein n=1 Tax=Phenylobacterium sp. TaxID=1871053 RepID=UPI003946BBA6
MDPHATVAVVLAGGEGRRMGGAKPLRRYGRATLLAHALTLARRWSPRVAVAVREPSQAGEEVDAPLILDDPAVPGPAAGLAAAFGFARSQGATRLLILPCDTPRLPADLLARLDAALVPGAAVAVASSGGVLHPVCALWRVEAAERLPAYLASGRASLRGFAADCGMVEVEWPAEPEDPFAGANTPEELTALQPRPALRRRHVLFYRALGGAAVGLAAAGVFLPLLPTTPFLLVALWAFARGAPELADKLRAHPKYGPYIRHWEDRRAIPPKAKAASVVMMSASWTGLALTTHSVWTVGGVGVVMVAVAGYVLTRPSA